MRYHDFDVWLDNPAAGGYPLRACCEPPHGEARDVSSLDPDLGPILEMRTRLGQEDTDKALLTEFGALLYSALFSGKKGDLEALFERCSGDFLRKGDEGIRVRLRIEPPKIAALPWELLYSRRKDGFLATCIETPVVRYVELMQQIPGLKVQLPIRMLVAVPEGSGLDTGTEISNLFQALEGLEKQVITTLLDKRVTATAISDALLEERYHVFHFIGHGEFQGDLPFLFLNDAAGAVEAVDHERFAGLFLNHPTMKLVLLNSCKGAEVSSTQPLMGLAPQLVKRGVPAVIAMQYAIGDDQAILFAREFYRALFRGSDKGRIEMAISHARNRLLQEFPGERVVGTPVLFSRAAEGVLFDLRTGEGLSDLPRTRSAIDTIKALIRTRKDNVKALKNEPEKTEEVAGAILQESAELRELKLRLRLGRVSVVAAFLVAPFLFGLFWLGVFDRLPPGLKLESYTVWLVEKSLAKTFSDQIALVPINDRTAAQLHRPLEENWRGEHAKLVERLSRAGARVIAFDVSFAGSREPAALDEEFSRAIRAAKERGTAVVAGIADVPAEAAAPVFAHDPSDWGLLCLGRAQGSTDILPLVVEKAGRAGRVPIPSLALAAVAAYNGWTIEGLDRETMSVRTKDKANLSQRVPVSELDELREQPSACEFLGAGDLVALRIIDFTPREKLRNAGQRFAYESILSWTDPRVAAGVNGKIVVVGVEIPSERFKVRRGLGMEDTFGYELHADAMSTLLRGIHIRPVGRGWQFLIILGLSLFGGILWAWYPHSARARRVLLSAATVAYLAAAVLAYWGDRLLLNTLYPLLALFGSYWILSRFRRTMWSSQTP